MFDSRVMTPRFIKWMGVLGYGITLLYGFLVHILYFIGLGEAAELVLGIASAVTVGVAWFSLGNRVRDFRTEVIGVVLAGLSVTSCVTGWVFATTISLQASPTPEAALRVVGLMALFLITATVAVLLHAIVHLRAWRELHVEWFRIAAVLFIGGLIITAIGTGTTMLAITALYYSIAQEKGAPTPEQFLRVLIGASLIPLTVGLIITMISYACSILAFLAAEYPLELRGRPSYAKYLA